MIYEKLVWSLEKNQQLLEERGICFEDVVQALEQNGALADIPHPNQQRYAHQRVLIVEIDGYACHVPYVVDGDALFLKTIFPSRKAQRLITKRDANDLEN
jgi:uncharacterized DUF497 family protein